MAYVGQQSAASDKGRLQTLEALAGDTNQVETSGILGWHGVSGSGEGLRTDRASDQASRPICFNGGAEPRLIISHGQQMETSQTGDL
jgi:hypothetical protein